MKHKITILLMIFLISCGSGLPAEPSATPSRFLYPSAVPSITPTLRRWASPTRLIISTAAPKTKTPTADEATVSVATPEPLPAMDRVYISPLSISLNNPSAITEITRLGKGKIKDFAWSPSGEMIAVANMRGVDFYFTRTLEKPSLLGYPAEAVVFLPDEKRMAMIVGSEVYLVIRSNGAVEKKLTLETGGNRGRVYLDRLYISPKGTTLILNGEVYDPQSSMSMPYLAAWNTSTGSQIFFQTAGRIGDLFFNPDGSYFVTDGELGMCVFTTGFGLIKYCHPHQTPAAFTTDGKRLIVFDEDGALFLLDAAGGEMIRDLGSSGKAKVYSSSRSGDGKRAVLYSDMYQVWDLEKVERTSQTGNANGYSKLLMSPDGHRMLAYDSDGESIDLINLDEDRVEGSLEYQPRVYDILFPEGPGSSNPGNELWVQYDSGDILRWTIDEEQAELKFDGQAGSSGLSSSPPRFWLSPDGRWISIEDQTSGEIGVIRRETMEKVHSMSAGWSAIAFSPDGRVMTVLDEKKLTHIDLQTGSTKTAELGGRFYGIRYADSQTILALKSASSRSGTELWDLTNKVKLASIESELDYPVFPDANFSPDGRLFVVVDNLGLLVFDRKSTGIIKSIRKPLASSVADMGMFGDGAGPSPTFDGIAIHPFVPIVATMELGGPIRLWNVQTGTLLTSLTPDCRVITDLAFGADGRYLAGGCEDGTVYIWGVRE